MADSVPPALANFARVDGRVWRGARPNPLQAAWLVALGVRTFLNLEWEASDEATLHAVDGADRLKVRCARIRDFEPLPWFAPSLADGHLALALATIQQKVGVTYVHCRSGENRTGVVVAGYRLLVRGDSLSLVLDDFAKYRGFWAWGDKRYIEGIEDRRSELLRRVAVLTHRTSEKPQVGGRSS